MLSSVSEDKEAVMCLTGKTDVLEKLHSCVSYSVIGHVFNVSELTVAHEIKFL